jgi:hypothetical protein
MHFYYSPVKPQAALLQWGGAVWAFSPQKGALAPREIASSKQHCCSCSKLLSKQQAKLPQGEALKKKGSDSEVT